MPTFYSYGIFVNNLQDKNLVWRHEQPLFHFILFLKPDIKVVGIDGEIDLFTESCTVCRRSDIEIVCYVVVQLVQNL